MAGNSIGQVFRVTSFGESHGPAIGCIIDGCPPQLTISAEQIQQDLNRRRPGQSRYTTQRREADEVKILSGVFEGKTTGTPIALLIENQDTKPKDYAAIKNLFRPGHADFSYFHKYGLRDYRGGGRSSARETATRVAAAAIARKYLHEKLGVRVYAYTTQIGEVVCSKFDYATINQNPFFCADPAAVDKIAQHIQQLRKQGDSCGARLRVIATGKNPDRLG